MRERKKEGRVKIHNREREGWVRDSLKERERGREKERERKRESKMRRMGSKKGSFVV